MGLFWQVAVACLLLGYVSSDNTTDTCLEPWDSGPWGSVLEEWALTAPEHSDRHGRVMALPPAPGYYVSNRVDQPPPPPPPHGPHGPPHGPPPPGMGPVPYSEWQPHPPPPPGAGKIVNKPHKDKPFKPSPSYPSNQYPPGPPPNQYQSGPPPNQYQPGPSSNQYQQGPPPNQYQQGPPPNQYQQGPPPNQYQQGPPPNQYQQGPPSNQYQQGPPQNPHRGPGPMPAADRIDEPPKKPGDKQVTETDLYLLTAIEKLVYRIDLMEKRLRRLEENVHYLVAGVDHKPEPCVSNFTRVGAACYHVSPEALDWKSASLRCRKLRAHLLELDTADERRTVVSAMLGDKKIRGTDMWTGGLNPGLLWIWSHSARPVLANTTTSAGAPSNASLTIVGEGRCLALLHDPAVNNYVYRGQDCALRHRYICEKEEDKAKLSNEIERVARGLKHTARQARTLLSPIASPNKN